MKLDHCLKQAIRLTAVLCALHATAPALAHHSQSSYDLSKTVSVEGTVYRLDYKNPHMYLIVQVTKPDGSTYLQQFEGLAVTQAVADGFDRTAFVPGSHIVVRANPNQHGPGRTMRGLDAITADGHIQPMYRKNAKQPNLVPATTLAGKWTPSLDETNRAFGALARWKFTPYGTGEALPGACYVEPIPFVAILDELRSIEMNDDTIVFHFNNSGDAADRVVHMDQQAHPADATPSRFGHSIGHFEGKTLVIDTVAYAVDESGISAGHPSGPHKHTIERLSLEPDGKHLRWDVTVIDPDSLVEPGHFSQLWEHRPDLEFTTVPCEKSVSDRYLED